MSPKEVDSFDSLLDAPDPEPAGDDTPAEDGNQSVLEEPAESEPVGDETGDDTATEPEIVENAVDEADSDQDSTETEPDSADSGDELADEPAGEETSEESKEPEAPRTFTVKVDGEERKVDETELIRGYQTAAAAQSRMREASEMQESAQFVLKQVIEDPFETLLQIYEGKGTPQQALEHLIGKIDSFMKPHYKMLTASDSEKRGIMAEWELGRVKKRQERDAEQAQKKERDDNARAYVERLQREIPEEMKKAGLNVEDKELHKLVINEIRSAIGMGSDLTPAEAVRIVNERLSAGIERQLKTLSADELMRRFPSLAEQIRKKDLERLKNKQQQRTAPTKAGEAAKKPTTPSAARPARRRKPKPVSLDEAFR